MAVNIRNLIRFAVVATTVFYLLDAGVDASRDGRKRRHRSKRTHGDKPRKARKSEKRHAKIAPHIVEAHGEPAPTQSEPSFTTWIPPQYYEKLLAKNKAANKIETDDSTDILSVVKAKVDFFVKHEPELTTGVDEFDSVEFELDSFHESSGVYGMHSQPDTVFGQVIHIEDAGRRDSHFGCGNAVANFREIPRDRAPWIALMARGHCSFFYKLKLAQRNNASAVLIYNDRPGDPPEMNTIGEWSKSLCFDGKYAILARRAHYATNISTTRNDHFITNLFAKTFRLYSEMNTLDEYQRRSGTDHFDFPKYSEYRFCLLSLLRL